MQKKLYTTYSEAQEAAKYRGGLIGSPLWIYADRGGYSLTSKGHHLDAGPSYVSSAAEYAENRPVTKQAMNAAIVPRRVYRLLYDGETDSFWQFFKRLPVPAIQVILKQKKACLIISLSQPHDAVRATRLVNSLRHGVGLAWFSFIYKDSLLITTGHSMHAARRPHENAEYIHRAMSLPNSRVIQEVDHATSDTGRES